MRCAMSDTGPPYVGRSLLRREDRRLLMGQGQFIADLVLRRMLHAVLVRSPVAHARIRAVDLSRASGSIRLARVEPEAGCFSKRRRSGMDERHKLRADLNTEVILAPEVATFVKNYSKEESKWSHWGPL